MMAQVDRRLTRSLGLKNLDENLGRHNELAKFGENPNTFEPPNTSLRQIYPESSNMDKFASPSSSSVISSLGCVGCVTSVLPLALQSDILHWDK
jgi:hypothetical protein